MKVVVFGGTGMVGQGVVRECLLDPGVETVLTVVRSDAAKAELLALQGVDAAAGAKLKTLVCRDLEKIAEHHAELVGYGACFYCLGISSAGMSEADYRKVTRDLTVTIADALLAASPAIAIVFVSGAGTDGTEKSRTMWARVKGETENAVFARPFSKAYAFRPAFIQPKHGIVSKTTLYRVLYAILGPMYPLLRLLFGKWVTTTDTVGKAMLVAVRDGAPHQVLENADINRLVAR